MAAEADKVVVELIAETEGFDAKTKQSASAFEQNMSRIGAAAASAEGAVSRGFTEEERALARIGGPLAEAELRHRRLAAAVIGTEAPFKRMGQAVNDNRIAQFELMHVVRGSTDSFASGTPVAQIFAQHIASVAEAASFAGGSLGKFGAIMSGPWGIAVTAGVAILTTLILKHHEASASVEELVGKLKEHAEKTDLNTQAQRIYDSTVEGSIAAMNKLTAEIDKQNLTLEDNIALKKAAIATSLTDVIGNIGTISTQLAQAIASYKEAQRVLAGIQSGSIAVGENPAAAQLAQQSRVAIARQQVSDLTAQLLGLNAAAEGGARALRSVDFPLLERNAKNAVNPVAAINQKYDDMAAKAKKAGTYTKELADQIERTRTAALKAEQDSHRTGSGLFGRQISFADAASIASGAGLNVTSAFRSTAHQAALFNDPSVNRPGNRVARPGTSAHEGVNGKWALDIAFAPGLTPDKVKRIYGDQGVSLTMIKKEAGHFHIEGSRSEAAADERAAIRAAEVAAKARQKESDDLFKLLNQHQDVTLEHEHQVNLIEDYNRGLSVSETLAGQNELALKDWNKQFEQIAASEEELNRFGAQLVDDVLNPDNWRTWGSAAKTVLHDVMRELIMLAAANPLKNLLTGSSLPTLGGLFSKLFGGGGGLGASIFPVVGGVDPLAPLPARASGGPVSAGQSYVVGEDGPEVFRPSSSGMIIPNRKVSPSNDRAVAPLAGMSPGVVHVLIEASKYFDGRVMEVSGPVIAQASVAAANGGATIGRRNLGRESMHRLE